MSPRTMASQKQIDANRRNAQKSTGPKSESGKDRTRFNGLKHGLRAEQVVLPGESRDEFEQERQAWFDDWKPTSHTRAVLAERAAVASWRLRRSVRVERQRLSILALEAGEAHDRARAALVDRAMERFDDDPEGALGLLRKRSAGLDHLLGMVDGLLADLEAPGGWRSLEGHYDPLMGLLGYAAGTEPDDVADEADSALAEDALLLIGSHEPERVRHLDGPVAPRQAEAARARLRARLGPLRADIAAERSRYAGAETQRARSVDVASFDASKESQLLHRYEMAHDRSLRATIHQLMALERSGADQSEWAEESPQAVDSETVESPQAVDSESVAVDDPAAPTGANPAPAVAAAGADPAAPTGANPGAAEAEEAPTGADPGPISTAAPKPERDRRGRTWPVGPVAGAESPPSHP